MRAPVFNASYDDYVEYKSSFKNERFEDPKPLGELKAPLEAFRLAMTKVCTKQPSKRNFEEMSDSY